MEPSKLGFDEINKVLMFACEGVNVGDKISHETSASKWGHLFLMTDEGAALAGLKLDNLKAQFSDLDDTEIVQIKANVKAKLDLIDDVTEETIEELLDVVVDGYNLVNKSLSLISKLKKK